MKSILCIMAVLCVLPSCGGGGKVPEVERPFKIAPDRVSERGRSARVVGEGRLVTDWTGVVQDRTFRTDIPGLPKFRAPGYPLLEVLYAMALEESLRNVRPDGAFMAGEKWNGVWTRDIAYSIHLALAATHPDVSRKSLLAKVSGDGEVIQDTGTGGSWPVSTDRVVWAIAAWELYCQTGDAAWLAQSYGILKKTALRDRHAAFGAESGLYYGESSFLDWREQTYPSWMEPVDIFESRALGTNMLHYRLLVILQEMAEKLGRPAAEGRQWGEWAATLKGRINDAFWMEDKGYYSAFLYPPLHGFRSDKSETLGASLAVLFGVADQARAARLLGQLPMVHYGVPCIHPQQPGRQPYHNRAIWPFVEAYCGWAGAEAGNMAAVSHILRSLVRAAALFGTHKENFVADTGDSRGTVINSDRQLWSVAGYLGIVHRILFGIRPGAAGITFHPAVPDWVRGPLTLTRYRYRGMELEVEVTGTGSVVRSLSINGEEKGADYLLPADGKGVQKIRITLGPAAAPGRITLVPAGATAPDETYVRIRQLRGDGVSLFWSRYKDAAGFLLYRDGKLHARTTNWQHDLPLVPGRASFFTVLVEGKNGLPANFSQSELCIAPGGIITVQAEDAAGAPAPLAQYSGSSGRGYVLLDRAVRLRFSVTVPRAGRYLVRFRYGNGNGPLNTDNKCAIRSLRVDGRDAATVVMPQRGFWSNWGYASTFVTVLTAGRHELELFQDAGDANMNGTVNTATLDRLELIPL